MTRVRNRITDEECRLTGEVDAFGLVGVRYDDDERTFFISPKRLETISTKTLAELRAEQLTDEPWSELKRTGTGGWQ